MFVINLFENKKQMVIYIILFILLLIGFIIVGNKEYKKDEIPDSEKFVKEHTIVSEDNVFDYINGNEVFTFIKNDNVLILFGNDNNVWVTYYAKILNETAKEVGISKIYYYNIENDRKEGNGTYQAIVEYLGDYITYLDDGTANIYVPTLYMKINGVVAMFDDESALKKGRITANKYWDEYQTDLKKNTLKKALMDYKKGSSENGKTQ